MSVDAMRILIEIGDIDGLRRLLETDPILANQPIPWFLNQQNESEPLHYVCDCFFHGWLNNGREAEIAAVLLEHGAAIDGTGTRESPLIAASSLGAEKVARLLIERGASLAKTSVHGAGALHWAAWVGSPATVEMLVERGAPVEMKCSEFGATPLFWAVHGHGPDGPTQKTGQVGAARHLILAGAKTHTANRHGLTALELATRNADGAMRDLLERHGV